MNLHGIVSGYISAINPLVNCTLRMSTGNYVPDIGPGVPVPTYADFPNIPCQIQPLSTGDLKHLDGLNLQGTYRAVYLNGNWEGVNRNLIKGGDLFITPDGIVWLVKQVLEHWPDWTKFACVMETD